MAAKRPARGKADKSTNATKTSNSGSNASAKTPARNAPAQKSGIRGLLLTMAITLFAVAVNRYLFAPQQPVSVSSELFIPREPAVEHMRFDIPCHMKKKSRGFIPGCHKLGKECGRALRDNFVTPEDIVALREIAEIGMANRSQLGGPTIMDVNTGFVKDGDGLVNIYQSKPNAPPTPRFTGEQFALYRDTIEKIRLALVKEFKLEHLYFTAPTFITRIVGNSSWEPAEMHDEYWHPHVDKANTHHYDYSGLLYLSDYGVEFTGGLFAFIDKKSEQIVEPARGRLMMFTSGNENLHQVRRVETGTRYVMSMWFTCDERRRFKNFLDGKMHVHFKREDI